MQWITADPTVSELSPHEQAIADLAIKVTTERSVKRNTGTRLSKTEELEELCGNDLPVEDLLAVGKVAALFTYWQQADRLGTTSAAAPEPAPARPRASLEPYLPYYFEGAQPPLATENQQR